MCEPKKELFICIAGYSDMSSSVIINTNIPDAEKGLNTLGVRDSCILTSFTMKSGHCWDSYIVFPRRYRDGKRSFELSIRDILTVELMLSDIEKSEEQ